jgi:hypothetical protein
LTIHFLSPISPTILPSVGPSPHNRCSSQSLSGTWWSPARPGVRQDADPRVAWLRALACGPSPSRPSGTISPRDGLRPDSKVLPPALPQFAVSWLFSASGLSRAFVLRPTKDAGGEGVLDSPVRGRARAPGSPANRVDDDRDREALQWTRARDPLRLSRRWSSQQAPTWSGRSVPHPL